MHGVPPFVIEAALSSLKQHLGDAYSGIRSRMTKQIRFEGMSSYLKLFKQLPLMISPTINGCMIVMELGLWEEV